MHIVPITTCTITFTVGGVSDIVSFQQREILNGPVATLKTFSCI